MTWPDLPFNPVTAASDALLSGPEILAGPFGLLVFAPLIPLIRLVARRAPRAALIGFGLVWLVATAGPLATLVVAGGLSVACGWVVLLARRVAAGRLSPRGMITLVWLGLTLLILPLWWFPVWSWYGWVPMRTAPLHFLGIAYFYLRLIAWGVDLAARPRDPLRPIDTICWLAYPPIMRLGPVMLRQEFLARLDTWNVRERIAWREVGRRAGLFLLGGVAIGVLGHNLPKIAPGAADFFEAPQSYSDVAVWQVFYLLPVQVYLILWTYNELAATLGLLVGIRVDNNFDWLPRSTSIKDFWRRWHVTVGRWLRTYIYIPLGGNQRLVALNIMAVFLFCGLWHGPSWSFTAWGATQGLALIVQRGWGRLRERWGWTPGRDSRLWIGSCWLLTLHFQLATVIVFVDFEYLGGRFLFELLRRAGLWVGIG